MSSVNKAFITGRVGKDLELKKTGSDTSVVNFSIATSETYKDGEGNRKEDTDWHQIVAWGKRAEVLSKYVEQGSLLHVEGPIKQESYEDKEGNTRYSTKIKVEDFSFLDSKPSENE